ncbi:IS30 family transposase [Polymorphospora rubra]|uniref:Transposase InsI for insertion sequence element IS30A n=1 Tax=Polymorphospora rubra TaxID=338584 RepID=A0A810MUN8_9ACTN|nr:IS30 family transposase [Polymorphospora rubra]BCJ64841.1 transposase InsI for insertion sequence element IS30A [Polymorphospora rubra]
MGRRGRKRRLDIESEYWLLLASGVGTVEACRRLGIGRKTGYRWRAENGGLPPAVLSESGRSQRYLSLLERHRIATLRRDGMGVRQIAEQLNRSPSTISRELRRNTAAHDHGYDGDLAHARARERARRRRPGRLLVDQELRAHVEAKLELEWSPEQIAAWLRVTFPDRPDWHVCHETIYQALYLGGRGGLRRQLTRRLRTGRPLRKRRRRTTERRTRFSTPGRLIDQRPDSVTRRERVGDWEGDLIIGRGNRSAIATLVDRRSRYLLLVNLPAGHDATAVRDALTATLAHLPASARHTLTWDQGSELAHHDHIAKHLAQGVFFAYPASPWQRGTNENTNGLVRQYFPKGTDLSMHGPEELRRVQDRLNNRPRKTLGWRTPTEIFDEAVRSS